MLRVNVHQLHLKLRGLLLVCRSHDNHMVTWVSTPIVNVYTMYTYPCSIHIQYMYIYTVVLMSHDHHMTNWGFPAGQ